MTLLLRYLFWFISFLIVAFGQNAWVGALGPLAAVAGYALFWRGLFEWKQPIHRFLIAVLWFAAVQAIQLSWMASIEYMGPLILVVYACILLALGTQFGFLSWLVCQSRPLTLWRSLAIAGGWVLMEWVRLFVSCGFTWNPVGLALTTWNLPLQTASLFGIYGLSFWVIFVNLTALRAWIVRSRAAIFVWGGCALMPFAWGVLQPVLFSRNSSKLSALLVQISLRPEQRDFDSSRASAYIPPFKQWDRLLYLIENGMNQNVDLIVLPEGALPYEAYRSVYSFFDVQRIWMRHFGVESQKDFPPLGEPSSRPMSQLALGGGFDRWKVSNAYWLQALANHYGCEIIAGMDDLDPAIHKHYNAAFHFKPLSNFTERSEKRVLVPVGEYIPLRDWQPLSKFISDQFGIGDSFEPGNVAKVFQSRIPIGVSICYEETYSALIWELRCGGAQMFVNISNDVWFPDSRLPEQHFDHGIVRAVENGVPSIRACNTGITGGVDCFGRLLASKSKNIPGTLLIDVPLGTFPTLYKLWGDWAILVLSAFFLLNFFRKSCSK